MPPVVPPLQIGRKLGSGFFGDVFLGQDGVHGRVAVKVLSRKPGHSDAEWDEIKSSFLAEAQKLSKAKHRNVVEVFHIEELPGGNTIRFCMAYCPGGSLQSAFEKGPMSLRAVRKAGTEVLLGLAALHSREMLHRDIKPGNVLLDGASVAQLGDFGLVTDDLLLGYGSQVGYSDHIAHEVWNGKGTSAKSDVWAFGMTLFRLLHGKACYDEMPDPQDVVPAGGFVETLKMVAAYSETLAARHPKDAERQSCSAVSDRRTSAWRTGALTRHSRLGRDSHSRLGEMGAKIEDTAEHRRVEASRATPARMDCLERAPRKGPEEDSRRIQRNHRKSAMHPRIGSLFRRLACPQASRQEKPTDQILPSDLFNTEMGDRCGAAGLRAFRAKAFSRHHTLCRAPVTLTAPATW